MGKSYLRNPPYPSTKYINLLSCLYFIELLSTGANQKSLKIPISANSFQLDCVLFSTTEILQVLHMTLQKLVANVRERFRATTSKSGSTLTLLTENIIYSIGKLLKISSRDAHFANQDKSLQNMVCSNIKFYLWKTILKNYPEGDLAKYKNETELLSRVFEHLSSAQFC